MKRSQKMNSVNLIGRLTDYPNVQYVGEKKDLAVANFTLAINWSEYITDFISCKAVGKTAEFIDKYATKGQKIGVSGSIRQDVWVDTDKDKHYRTYVFVNRVDFAESKREDKENDKNKGKNKGRR